MPTEDISTRPVTKWASHLEQGEGLSKTLLLLPGEPQLRLLPGQSSGWRGGPWTKQGLCWGSPEGSPSRASVPPPERHRALASWRMHSRLPVHQPLATTMFLHRFSKAGKRDAHGLTTSGAQKTARAINLRFQDKS